MGREEGEPVDMVNFRNRLYLKACDKAGLRRRRFHDTRHHLRLDILMAGESPAYVKEQLGHKPQNCNQTRKAKGPDFPGPNLLINKYAREDSNL